MIHTLAGRLAGMAVAAALAIGLVSPAAAETWKLGTAAQPGSVLHPIVMQFVEDFNAAFKDDGIQLEFQFIGNEQEMMQQLIRGRVEIGATSFAGSAVAIPENAVTTIPYLFANDEERIFVMDNHAVPVLRDIAAEKGAVMLTWGDVGWNDVICNFECLTLDSLKGVKARVSPVSRHFWQAMQANGVQMPLSEFFPGLQQGLVVAGDLPFLYYVTTPAAQSAPHYVTTRHLHHGAVWYVSKSVFDRLSADQQAKLMEAAPKPAETRPIVMGAEMLPDGEAAKKFVAEGGKIHILDEAARKPFMEAVQPLQEQIVKDLEGSTAPKARSVWDAVVAGKKAFADKK